MYLRKALDNGLSNMTIVVDLRNEKMRVVGRKMGIRMKKYNY